MNERLRESGACVLVDWFGWRCGEAAEETQTDAAASAFIRHGGNKKWNRTSGSGDYVTEVRSDGQLLLPPVSKAQTKRHEDNISGRPLQAGG